MKKFVMLVAAMLMVGAAFAQPKATKPTLMVMPSDNWCIQNGYIEEFDDQGTIKKVPDYRRALQENADLLSVISMINNMMTDRGFPLQNLETMIARQEQRRAQASATQSSQGGSVQRSFYDELQDRVTADIKLQLSWDVIQRGPQRSIRYNLQGLDTYTGKQVAGEAGIGAPSLEVAIPILLEEAVFDRMDNFCNRLQMHFDDLFANGREVTMVISVFETSEVNLESEVGGYELAEVIENYLAENTVNSSYSIAEQSENVMICEQVRIPVFQQGPNGRQIPMNAARFGRNLVRYLKGEPYQVDPIKVQNQGLGQVTLTIGDK